MVYTYDAGHTAHGPRLEAGSQLSGVLLNERATYLE
jgi:hypothetical protein